MNVHIPVLSKLFEPIALPRMVRVRQKFPDARLTDIGASVREALDRDAIRRQIRPGMKIAVACGSRGVTDIDQVVRHVVRALQEAGAEPFVFPAMGSHGGATAEGQRKVLAQLGVTEAACGCPIVSSMEVVQVATAENGDPVYVDKHAWEADGIVLTGRIKPHTDFQSTYESGLVKMMVIGLGKQKGAESCHRLGPDYLPGRILLYARHVAARAKILFGVGVVENAYHQLCRLEALTVPEIFEREPELLQYAYRNMAQILFKDLDVLVVDEIGKELSGGGADPNVTGRFPTDCTKDIAVRATCCVYLRLTEATDGNACGLGLADIITERLFNQIDFAKTYPNSITSTLLHPSKIPMVMESDRDALRLALYACRCQDRARARVVRVTNTEALSEIQISEGLLEQARQIEQVEILSEPEALAFDSGGNLLDCGGRKERFQ